MKNRHGPTYLPALKGRIGKWAFYTTLMTLDEVNERIYLSNEIYRNKSLSDMVQRSVKSGRAEKIASYLKNEEERFFPAMVVAVFEGEPNWLEFSIRKQNENLEFDPNTLDRAKLDSFGFLSLSGDERLFPLDGQHRLAGIREALADPDAANRYLGSEEVTVMLVAHDPSDSGRTRSRRLFTTLNKRAVSVKKHETIALDEDDVMAIATRHLIERFEPLSREGIVSFRTNANILPGDTKTFTAIVTIYDLLFDLFKVISKRSPEDLKFNRPDDAWTDVYRSCAEHFFVSLMNVFPEVKRCLMGNDSEKVIAENRRENGGHLLFRPVGLRMIAQIVAVAVKRSITDTFEDAKQSPSDVQQKVINEIGKAVANFSALPTELAEKPYAGLIFDAHTHRISVGRSALVRDIILKKYGFTKPSGDGDLNRRIKRSVGEAYSVDDFMW
jgi:DNA sulfur modification protein DndB